MITHPSSPSHPLAPVQPKNRRPTLDMLPAAARPTPAYPAPKPGHDRFGQPVRVDKMGNVVEPPQPVPARVASPEWPDPKNTAWEYRPADPMPPVAEPETLGELARARGQAALDDVVGVVRAIDRLLVEAKALDDRARAERARPNQWADRLMAVLPNFGRARPQVKSVAEDLTARRGIYFDRVVGLASLLKVEMPALIDPRYQHADAAKAELGKVDAVIDGLKATTASTDAYGRLGVQPAQTVASIDEEIIALAEARAEATQMPRAGAPVGPRPVVERTRTVFPQDEIVASLNAYHRRRRELVNQVDALEAKAAAEAAKAAELVKATAGRVNRAVQAAGGNELVVSAIVAALALSEAPQPASPELAKIDADLSRLAEAGVTGGPSVESLRTRRAELTAAAESRAKARVTGRRSRAEGMLKLASEGQEAARAEIEALARSCSAAFPAGFAAAVA